MRRLAALALTLALAAPAAAVDIPVGPDALRPAGPLGFLVPRLDLPKPDPALPVIDPARQDPAAGLLRRLAARGEAAGFAGIVYDNRDRGHSTLPPGLFPALPRIVYDAALRARGLDYGLGGEILWPAPTLGNSSTAITGGNAPRSLPRAAMTMPGGPARATRSYLANMVYLYPEHRDHDDVDLYPAAWPYMVVSQGSSGSDQPFLRALAMTLAAFRPEVRDRLVAEGLVAPTLQMILRRAYAGGYAPELYLSPAAHPGVFDAARLVPERMVAAAAALSDREIPPLVRLNVEAEDFAPAAGLAGMSERLYTTPAAIARIWRGLAGRHEVTLSAAETRDPNDRDLTFRWIVLRGDPARVQVTPLDARGSRARVRIDWHDAYALPDGRITSRIDIAAIAWNGAQFSAPAFFSVSFPTHQIRRYEPGPDGAPRIAAVDYRAEGRPYDPVLHWSADWRDAFTYDEAGQLTAITRTGPAGEMTLDATGQPASGPQIGYQMDGPPRRPRLVTTSDDGNRAN